jgi:cytoskeleton protein RodZ
MASLGQDLKKERELRGISLKEISDSTKISLRFLRALEEDQLDLLPGRFFIKGILRSYADYLGLDESSVLNKFYEEEQYRQQQESGDKQDYTDSAPEIPKSFKNKVFFGITFLVIVAVLSSLYFIFQKDKKDLPSIQTDPAPARKEVIIPPPPVEKAPVAAAEEMKLAITFQQDTWIQLYIDGELLLDGIKYPGEEFSTTATKEIIINVGNAGGLTYSINQRAGKSLGRSGQVVRNIRITPDNLKDFAAQDKEAPNGR